ncbi:MAG TPA: Mur ligase domain-containing protein, partial [Amnibacterium sp.]|nr:Mur ligase domain-containing protein [Amnibacterium sp.]
MIALTLAEITRAVDGTLELGDSGATADTVVDGPVETDHRDLVPGGVFVARRGETTDGHRFAPEALEAGAALLIAERTLPLAVPQIVVADSTDALAALAAFVVATVRARGRLRVVGVTGSNGKTTTKNLLREICGRAGVTVASRAS